MKKTLTTLSALMMALPVMAADNCAYSPLQNLIRNVRSVNEINDLLQRGIVFDEKVRCGGSLTQLAILRGNPDVLMAILNQDRSRANTVVSLDSYAIQGAPREIPILLFAAYYAPNAEIVARLVEAGADVAKTDSLGRNVLWYMDQNPVLRNTSLSDLMNQRLLSSLVPVQRATPMLPIGFQPQQGAMPGGGSQPVAPTTPVEPVATAPSVVEATVNQ